MPPKSILKPPMKFSPPSQIELDDVYITPQKNTRAKINVPKLSQDLIDINREFDRQMITDQTKWSFGIKLIIFFSIVIFIFIVFIIYYLLQHQPCKKNCSDQGKCNWGTCSCDHDFVGEDCSQKKCTDCSGNGICNSDGYCKCNSGFDGQDCSIRK
jgi:hypothetical protein